MRPTDQPTNPIQSAAEQMMRTIGFWSNVSGVYASYKLTQLHAALARAAGTPEAAVQRDVWDPRHDAAGKQIYQMCVNLRGFYLKAGQFVGARGDFVPAQWCSELSALHDQVPPMPPRRVTQCLQGELGVPLDAVFEWIDLEQPLGSASISQVHKAKLRGTPAGTANDAAAPAVAARLAVQQRRPSDGVVAVKVQYPDAARTMQQDMHNLRLAAAFLQKTELKFDLVSAVDELSAQLKLEFDFEREARVMDAVSRHLMSSCKSVIVPRSIPGLVTQRMLVMEFLDGTQITRLGNKMHGLSEAKRAIAKRMIMSHVSEAYGRMLLLDGLFQADGHPGNILVLRGGKVGLLDYGQSKKLPDDERLGFASLILALGEGDPQRVSDAMWDLGIVTDKNDAKLRTRMAYDMFDTAGTYVCAVRAEVMHMRYHRLDVWSPDSPLKQTAISTFPKDLFFVLRVCQLLRGLSNGMGLTEFSTAKQWQAWARQALRDHERGKTIEAVLL